MKLQEKILSGRLLDLLRGKKIATATLKGEDYQINPKG